jgi:uncharacterized protein
LEPQVRHKIRVDEIPAAGLTYRVDQGDGAFSKVIADALEGEKVLRCGVSVDIRKTEQRITIEGALEADLELACARCTTAFALDVRRPIQAVMLLEAVPEDEEDVELAAEQLDESYLEGDVIDLHELVREQVLLALPEKPLCSRSCKGLCPICGADLNEDVCECTDTALDPRLAVLADLNLEEDN